MVFFKIKVLSHVTLGRELCQYLEHVILQDVTIFKCVAMLQIGKKAAAELKCMKRIYTNNELTTRGAQCEEVPSRYTDTEECRARWKAKISTVRFFWSLKRTESMKMYPEKK